MTQEDKQLLLQDLCARLPYRVYVDYSHNAFDVHKGKYIKYGSKCILKCHLLDVFLSPRQDEKGEYIKPYLRSMSSMTEKEKKEYNFFFNEFAPDDRWPHITENFVEEDIVSDLIDWLNKNMFDFRGFIPKGLANEAPEGMYNL